MPILNCIDPTRWLSVSVHLPPTDWASKFVGLTSTFEKQKTMTKGRETTGVSTEVIPLGQNLKILACAYVHMWVCKLYMCARVRVRVRAIMYR